jgi:altronate dehydratase small subunit
MVRAIVLNANDNVATLIDSGSKGDAVVITGEGNGELRLVDDVAFGHKAATGDIATGEPIRKYGKVIGQATATIKKGAHVHVHNVEALRARGDKKEPA